MASRLIALAALGALALAALAVTPAQAQATPGKLYFTNTVITPPAGAGGTGPKTFALTDVTPVGTTPLKAYLGTSQGVTTYVQAWNYTPTVPLALSGNIEVTVKVSCESLVIYRPGPQSPVTSSAMSLAVDGTVVSSHNRYDTSPTTCQGPTEITTIDFTLDTKSTPVPAGKVLELQFLLWATNTDESVRPNLHVLTGTAEGSSVATGVGLPSSGPGGAPGSTPVMYHDISGSTATATATFQAPATAVHRYNWTTSRTDVDIDVTATASNGTAAVKVLDASGKVLLNRSVSRSGTEHQRATGQAGKWQIEIAGFAFAGSVTVKIGDPHPETTASSTTTGGNTGTGTTTGGTTGTGGGGRGGGGGDGTTKPATAFGFIYVVAALAIGLASTRRRLA